MIWQSLLHRRIPTTEPLTLITCYVILHVNQPWVTDDDSTLSVDNILYPTILVWHVDLPLFYSKS